jgi:hypothetical protein
MTLQWETSNTRRLRFRAWRMSHFRHTEEQNEYTSDLMNQSIKTMTST